MVYRIYKLHTFKFHKQNVIKKTTNIDLDINIWIYLTKDTFNGLWMKFKEMKEKGVIKVILNDTIVPK